MANNLIIIYDNYIIINKYLKRLFSVLKLWRRDWKRLENILKLLYLTTFKRTEMEFKEFEPWFKSAKTEFKFSAGLNLKTFDTILKLKRTVFKPRLKFKPPLKFFKFDHWRRNLYVWFTTISFTDNRWPRYFYFSS